MKVWRPLLAAYLFGYAAVPARAAASVSVPVMQCAAKFLPAGGAAQQLKDAALTGGFAAVTAARMALFSTSWVAVLAPRGWQCMDLETPESGVLYIWPAAAGGNPLTGPAVVVKRFSPLNSYGIDQTYFPDVYATRDKAALLAGPAAPRFGSDAVWYDNPRVLAYATPAGQSGLGFGGAGPGGATAGAAAPALPSIGLLAHSLGKTAGLEGVLWLNIRMPAAFADVAQQSLAMFAPCLPDADNLTCESGGVLPLAEK